jgi:hypothetical protein
MCVLWCGVAVAATQVLRNLDSNVGYLGMSVRRAVSFEGLGRGRTPYQAHLCTVGGRVLCSGVVLYSAVQKLGTCVGLFRNAVVGRSAGEFRRM